jgi:hypothetical protein
MAQKGQGSGSVMGYDWGLMEGRGATTTGVTDAFRVEL